MALQGFSRRIRKVPVASSNALMRCEMTEGVTCRSAAARSKDPLPPDGGEGGALGRVETLERIAFDQVHLIKGDA